MTEKTIKDILTNYEPEPSAKCWESLSHRLDAAMPTSQPTGQQPAAAKSVPQTPVTQHVAHAFWTTGTKIAAAVLGTAAATTATVLIVVNTNKDTASNTSQPAAATTDTLVESNPELATEIDDETYQVDENSFANTTQPASATETEPAENKTVIEQIVAKPQPTEKQPVAQGTTTVPQIQAPVNQSQALNHNTTASNASNKPTGKPNNQSGQSVEQPTHPTPIAKPQPTPQPVVQPQVVQDDPALQDLPDDAIDFTPPVKIEIPNVFTPNGDGINDYFVILGIENCVKRQLIVRNRANQIVYKSDSYENRWSGDNCPDGIYYYQFVFNNGTIDQKLSGMVYIVRK